MFSSGRLFYKQVDSIPKILNSKVRVKHFEASNQVKEEIIIPARIERGPTDILKALAATVSIDPSGFPYKYPDDPYFYTYNTSMRRVISMAMESGRKSAKWVIQQNPGFFKHQLADPPIEVFLQKPERGDDRELTEEDLLYDISERNVLEAIKVYETLKSQQVDVANSTKQSLLELVCFYNSKARPDVHLEGKWYADYLGKAGAELVKEDKWNKVGFAETLFNEMDPNCPLANSAILQGRLKYGEVKSAVELYQSLKENKMVFTVGVYNMLLSESEYIASDRTKISEFVEKTLAEMAKSQIKPNLGTLNAALKALSNTSMTTLARRLIKEFFRLGIEPSLGSYGYLFQICSRRLPIEKRAELKPFVANVLQHLEDGEHEVLHPCDLDFFIRAMDAFVDGFGDADLALRLSEMYVRHNNAKFFVRAQDEHGFFKQMMFIVFKYKPFDLAMDAYRRFVFTVFCPDSKVLTAIITALNKNYHPEYLPKVWEDLKKLGYSKNRPILGRLFELMKNYTDETSLKVFHEAALLYLEKINSEKKFRSGDEEHLLKVLVALIKNDDEQSAVQVAEIIRSNNLRFVHVPDDFLRSFFEYATSKKNVPLILESLRLSVEYEFSGTSEMAEKALPLLGAADEAWVAAIVKERKDKEGTKPKEDKD